MADNVVLICVDQWRGDCLSIDDHPVVQTPYLDGLASNGVRFRRAYSATPTCIPARAALLTGLSQRSHGRVGYQDGVPWNYPVTIASEFTRQGYQTQAIGKMHVFPERSQMGFQNVTLHDGFLHFARKKSRGDLGSVDDYLPWLRRETGRPESGYFDHGVNCNSVIARPWDKEEYLHPTNWVVHESVDFLRRRDPRKPFFLMMSFHRPHPPYDPPAWAFEMYRDREMPGVPIGDWGDVFARHSAPRKPDAFAGRIDPLVLQRARAGYYGHMSHIDHQINRFIETLNEYGQRDNTWICFVSDHGEMMGDHDLFRKGYPYEGSARVPLILSGPASARLRNGAACDGLAELRDIMPTLLNCAGLEIPDTVKGKTLLPLACGDARTVREYLHGEHTLFGQSIQWITDDRYKFIWHSQTGHEQLFDMQSDPQELHDIARRPSSDEQLQRLRQLLIAELKDREEGFAGNGDLIAGRPVQPLLSQG